jgi:predicted N-acetyltransferase YhbS
MPAGFTHAPTQQQPTDVEVRDAGPADREDIRAVVEAAYAQFKTVLPPTVYARYLADLLDLDGHTRHGQLLVAEVDGRIRGSAAFYPNTYSQGMGWPRGWAGVRGLAVHPEARGFGIARALLYEAETRARLRGARVFAFHTATFMTEAIALYERLGYCRIPHFDVDVSTRLGFPGSKPIMVIAFRRHLRDDGPCAGGSGATPLSTAFAPRARRPR